MFLLEFYRFLLEFYQFLLELYVPTRILPVGLSQTSTVYILGF